MRGAWLGTVLGLATVTLGFALHACSSDDAAVATEVAPTLPPGPRLSRKGEACQTTSDCSEGLSCLPPFVGVGSGTCVTGEFNVSPTAKECVKIQCEAPLDCCASLANSPGCPSLKAQCDQAIDAGLEPADQSGAYCKSYRLYCVCDESRFRCDQGTCIPGCTTDSDCSLSGGKCNKGVCAQCASDADCSNGMKCMEGLCRPPCRSDSECPAFNRCAAGECVASGCKSDRECVGATGNVDAKCANDKCVIACQTDLECGNPKAYSFYSCLEGQCTYTGCESDKDCLFFFVGPTDAGLPPGTRAVCR